MSVLSSLFRTVLLGSLLYSAAGFRFIIDQAGDDVGAFTADNLRSFGVLQTAQGSIDCTSYLNGIPGGPWYNASGLSMVAESIKSTQETIAQGKAAGLQVYMSSDIFQFPTLLLDRYMANLTWPGVQCIGYTRARECISILSPFTQQAYRLLFDELLQNFPDLDGLVLRYGENSPCAYHQGNAPYDSTNTSTAISSLTALIQFLREELCVQRNLTVLFRTWDTSTTMLHADTSFYSAVLDPVEPHPNLVFSIKHTMLDFWRRVRFNPTLGVGRHQQVVEAEVGGMYGGCGTWPLCIGQGIIESYPEYSLINASYGLRWLAENKAESFAGVLMNHQCTTTPAAPRPWLWWYAEEAVLAGWAMNPSASEAELFDAHVQSTWSISNATARDVLHNVTLWAMDANLAMQTVAVFDSLWPQNDRPTSNWMLWNGLGGLEQLANTTCHAYNVTHCETFPWLYNNSLLDVALAEKDGAVDAYRDINSTVWSSVMPYIGNSTIQTALAASVEAGVRVSQLIAAGWHVMALGYAGDRAGGVYNVTALRQAIATYDTVRAAYISFPSNYPPNLAPGLMSDRFWEHPTSGAGGMGQSVDQYRGTAAG